MAKGYGRKGRTALRALSQAAGFATSTNLVLSSTSSTGLIVHADDKPYASPKTASNKAWPLVSLGSIQSSIMSAEIGTGIRSCKLWSRS